MNRDQITTYKLEDNPHYNDYIYALHKLFSNPEYCKEELCRIREAIGYQNTYQKNDTLEAIRRVLGFMLIYCNDEFIVNYVNTLFEELARREFYAITSIVGLNEL